MKTKEKKSKWPKLPVAFKRKWVKALRSRKFKKGLYQLYSKTSERYCCLGVACVVGGLNEVPEIETISSCEAIRVTPKEIQGSTEDNPLVNKLTGMNDGEQEEARSFKYIASWIEENL